MTVLLVALLVLLVTIPHRIGLERSSPIVASIIWLSSLILRAAGTLLGALLVTLMLASSSRFKELAHWCWHERSPIAPGLPVSGHVVAGVIVALPLLALAYSGGASVVVLCRGARGVQRLLRTSVGPGPESSVVLSDRRILVGSAGFHQPKVIVSAGALLALDDAELSASLAHERGHIIRRHRFLLVAGEICSSIAGVVPGSRTALGELTFHLERDADRYAVAAGRNPAALASAIYKAAGSPALVPPASLLGGGSVARRIRLLLAAGEEGREAGPAQRQAPFRVLAGLMLAVAALSLAVLPPRAHASAHGIEARSWFQHCSAGHDRAADSAAPDAAPPRGIRNQTV